MELTKHEISEFRRAAKSLIARHRLDEAALLLNVACEDNPSLANFDKASSAYRAWLCFNLPA